MRVSVDSIGAEVRAEHHVSIRRDRDTVFAYLADGRNVAAWRCCDYEITKSEPCRELRVDAVAGSLHPKGVFRLTPDGDDSTLVSFALELEPRGRLRLRGHHIRRVLAAAVAQLGSLKSVLEA